ncbi:MAG: bifunctional riboflavin kinase/FAD synthetase [candidate division NC10 bacterium]|nr:bifunctional riboflavin kinase/FAD synthetase [candidate division NC10 bacterium]
MIVVERVEDLAGDYPYVVVALGTFDGVHLGHQEILGRVVRRARQERGTATVFTFVRHPLEVVNHSKAPPLITPLPIKQEIIRALGIDLLVAVTFSPFLADTPPRDFVKTYLVDRLRARCVCVGYDFAFGKGRAGSPDTLRALGEEHQFGLDVVPAMTVDSHIVSSTLIRGLLSRGELVEAARYLGRPYAIRGEVERGAGRGKGLGYPTANLPATADVLIPDGVYVGQAWYRKELQRALVNVGTAPTFGGGARRIEVHLIDASHELYGETLTLFVLGRLRDERRFESPELLRQQIEIDRRRADDVFAAFPRFSPKEWALLP